MFPMFPAYIQVLRLSQNRSEAPVVMSTSVIFITD